MNTAGNQTYSQTEKKIRESLLFYMKQQQEPTIGQLCEHAHINRSTFYRHYQDIFDLMNKTENELQQGLVRILTEKGEVRDGLLEQMISYIGNYQAFYRIYLKKHADNPFEAGFQTLFEDRIKKYFQKAGVVDEHRMLYYYGFVRAGASQVLKLWIDGGCTDTPREISEIIKAMLASTYL